MVRLVKQNILRIWDSEETVVFKKCFLKKDLQEVFSLFVCQQQDLEKNQFPLDLENRKGVKQLTASQFVWADTEQTATRRCHR